MLALTLLLYNIDSTDDDHHHDHDGDADDDSKKPDISPLSQWSRFFFPSNHRYLPKNLLNVLDLLRILLARLYDSLNANMRQT